MRAGAKKVTRRRCLAWLAAGLLARGGMGAAAGEADAEQVARRFVAAQDGLENLSGRFLQLRSLRNVRRPIETRGRFWFDREGRFRWQVEQAGEDGAADEPTVRLIALREPDGSVLILQPGRRTGERMPPERAAEAAGGLALMQPGTNSDWEQFDEVFRVRGGWLDERTRLFVLDLRLRDRRASMAVFRVLFHVDPEGGGLAAFELFFRDGSSIFTRFSDLVKNGALPAGVFDYDTGGYEIDEAD